MKKQKIAAVLFVLVTTSALFFGCIESPYVATETEKTENYTKEEDKELIEEFDENGICIYAEFPSNNENWKLCFDNREGYQELKLGNDKKTYTYGDYRGFPDKTCYSFAFATSRGKESMSLTVSENEKYAVIIHDNVQYTIDQPKSQGATVVSLESGKVLICLSASPEDILRCCGVEESMLEKYVTELEKPRFEQSLTAVFDENKVVLTERLLSDDGALDLYATYSWDPEDDPNKVVFY